MSDKKDKDLLHCSFCGKGQDEVKQIIAGPDVWICDECISLCMEIIGGDVDSNESYPLEEIPSPTKIKEYLDQYVIGQDPAKKVVSVAVHNHFKRLAMTTDDDTEIQKSNVLLLGPTGSGKTLIAQSIAKMLDVPFAICDATTLTEAGYVGDDVEAIIARLLQVADYNVEKAERGIIFIDEIDKKGRKGDNASITRDVSGEGVQQALLKIIEGTECRVPPQGGRKHPAQELITVNTKEILFFVSGAFVGIDKVISERINEKSSIGFGNNITKPDDKQRINELLAKVEQEDFVKFGLIPELVGRLPVYSHLEELSEEQLVQVLTEPKNAIIKQTIKMFKYENVVLEFTLDALLTVAKIAKIKNTGARGLRSVIENSLIEIQYQLPELAKNGAVKVIVDKETIENKEFPTVVYEEKKAS